MVIKIYLNTYGQQKQISIKHINLNIILFIYFCFTRLVDFYIKGMAHYN